MIFGTCCNDILAWNSGVHSQTHDSCLVTPSKLSYSCVPAKNMFMLILLIKDHQPLCMYFSYPQNKHNKIYINIHNRKKKNNC